METMTCKDIWWDEFRAQIEAGCWLFRNELHPHIGHQCVHQNWALQICNLFNAADWIVSMVIEHFDSLP